MSRNNTKPRSIPVIRKDRLKDIQVIKGVKKLDSPANQHNCSTTTTINN